MFNRCVAHYETDPNAGNRQLGDVVSSRHTLDGFAFEPGCVEGVQLRSLEAGTAVNVITRHSHYRLVVIDPARQARS